MVMHAVEGNQPAAEFISDAQSRIQQLFKRLEKIDVEVIKTLHTQISKKRSCNLYFKALGRMSAYKCITKGLKSERLVDYLGIACMKLRV